MKYINPILSGDYSDPDVIRVGEDFYMISSSFTYVPGIPVLHSRDLTHWELLGYAAERLPFSRYDEPAHKCGTWAPSIRFHQGRFYVYVCMPDEGLFAFTAEDPAGTWECHYVKDTCGWIDPCPLFEEDGKAYLIHGFAASRCGIHNVLYVHRMSPDGLRILDCGRMVYCGDDCGDVTVEGPKFYRRQGKYWILCPAGGVKPGYQLALRADQVYGPYERRVVLRQGSSRVNGPHQGGWTDDGRGGDWFIHFQDVGPYGRVPHLQPVDWSSGWPVMGKNGEPVTEGEIGLPPFEAEIPTSDRFAERIGPQWQWQANPNPRWYALLKPGVRLFAAPADSVYHAGQFLSQLMQARDFEMDVRMGGQWRTGDSAGIVMMGYPYHMMLWEGERITVYRGEVQEGNRWIRTEVTETPLVDAAWSGKSILLRLRVNRGKMSFLYGAGEESLHPLGQTYPLYPAGWTGARPGIVCLNRAGTWGGFADVQEVQFRLEAPIRIGET